MLRGIRWLLYSDGYTIKGVQRILRDSGVRFVKECWRSGTQHPDKKPAETPLPIPNLAGEVAKEARRGRSTVSQEKRGPDVLAAETPRNEEIAGGGQRALLASVLAELEECRDMLRAAAKPEDGTAKKPRAEQRRGVQA